MSLAAIRFNGRIAASGGAGQGIMGVCVLGSINLDNVCRVPRIPVAGETLMADGFERFAGGKGANQAVAAAAWGARSMLLGAVGRDAAGETLLAHLTDRDVDVSGVLRLADAPSGQAHICVSACGENMIVVIGGANRALTATDLAGVKLDGMAVFLAQLETPIDVVEALFASPAARSGVTILNAAPAVAAGRSLFPLADIIVVNQVELGVYAESPPPDTAKTAVPLARRLITRADQTVVVTLGSAGALAVTARGHVAAEGAPATVVDTTGAGDCFCGVLAAALSEGASPAGALAWANQAAAISTERAGASVPATLRAEAERRIKAVAPPRSATPPRPEQPTRVSHS